MSEDNGVVDTADGLPDELGGDPKPSWHWSNSEGAEIAGDGDRPEWLLPKYNSVEAQAQAYPHLQKMAGNMTGAPDEYSMDFLGEDNDQAISEDGMKMMRDHGVPQDAFEDFVSYHNKEISDVVDYFTSADRQMEMLGDNAEQRVDMVNRYLQANLDESDYSHAADLINSAEAVQLMEMMIDATAPKKLPSEGGPNPDGMTEEKLDAMRNAKDENGGYKMNDPEYRARYEDSARRFYGGGADIQLVDFG